MWNGIVLALPASLHNFLSSLDIPRITLRCEKLEVAFTTPWSISILAVQITNRGNSRYDNTLEADCIFSKPLTAHSTALCNSASVIPSGRTVLYSQMNSSHWYNDPIGRCSGSAPYCFQFARPSQMTTASQMISPFSFSGANLACRLPCKWSSCKDHRLLRQVCFLKTTTLEVGISCFNPWLLFPSSTRERSPYDSSSKTLAVDVEW